MLLKIFLLENACVMVVVPKIDKSSLLFKIGWASAHNVNFLTKPRFSYMRFNVFTVPIDSDVTILI